MASPNSEDWANAASESYWAQRRKEHEEKRTDDAEIVKLYADEAADLRKQLKEASAELRALKKERDAAVARCTEQTRQAKDAILAAQELQREVTETRRRVVPARQGAELAPVLDALEQLVGRGLMSASDVLAKVREAALK